MRHLVEGLCVVKVCDINGISIVHHLRPSFQTEENVGLAGLSFNKSMLLFGDEAILSQECHNPHAEYLFKYLTQDGREGYRPKVCHTGL